MRAATIFVHGCSMNGSLFLAEIKILFYLLIIANRLFRHTVNNKFIVSLFCC